MAELNTIQTDNSYFIDSRGEGVIDVRLPSDLPLLLPSGTYKLKASVSVERLTFAPNAFVRFISDGPSNVLTLTGTGSLIGDGTVQFNVITMRGFDVALTGATATLFDMDGALFGASELNFLCDATKTHNLGSIENSLLSISFIECIISDFTAGIFIDGSAESVVMKTCTFRSTVNTGTCCTFGTSIPDLDLDNVRYTLANGTDIFSVASGLSGAATINNIKNFNPSNVGFFAAGSLTEDSPKVDVMVSPPQPDSQNIAFGTVNGNTGLTAVTDGVYTAINTTGLVSQSLTSRYTLTTPATGLWTYNGLTPIKPVTAIAIHAKKTGSTANYRFAISINGAVPVFATAFYQPMEVKTTKVHTPIIIPVSITTTDTIQVMIAGDGTGDDITITDVSMVM